MTSRHHGFKGPTGPLRVWAEPTKLFPFNALSYRGAYGAKPPNGLTIILDVRRHYSTFVRFPRRFDVPGRVAAGADAAFEAGFNAGFGATGSGMTGAATTGGGSTGSGALAAGAGGTSMATGSGMAGAATTGGGSTGSGAPAAGADATSMTTGADATSMTTGAARASGTVRAGSALGVTDGVARRVGVANEVRSS